MQEDKRQEHERRAEKYLREVSERYVRDPSNRLYYPESREAEDAIERQVRISGTPEVDVYTGRLDVSVRKGFSDWLVVLLSVATFGLLCATAFFTYRQWQAAKTANNLNRQANWNSQQASNKTLKATTDSNRIAGDSLVSVQRAFVIPSVEEIPLYFADGKIKNGEALQVSWQNTGNTPTKGLVIQSFIEHVGFNGKTANVIPEPIPYKEAATFLGPKGTVLNSRDDIDMKLLKATFDSDTPLHFRGVARYYDVFPNTRQHITRYCYEMHGMMRYSLFENPTTTYSPIVQQCKEGNCTDDECKDK